jgi:hypothetical protein
VSDLLNFAQYNSVFTSQGGIPVTFTPQDGSDAQTIQAIVMPPALAEEIMGGLRTAVLRLWVDFQLLSPLPQEGDQFTVGGRTYVLGKPEAEPESTGGAILKLRSM